MVDGDFAGLCAASVRLHNAVVARVARRVIRSGCSFKVRGDVVRPKGAFNRVDAAGRSGLARLLRGVPRLECRFPLRRDNAAIRRCCAVNA